MKNYVFVQFRNGQGRIVTGKGGRFSRLGECKAPIREIYETHLADSTLDDNTMYRFFAAHLVALQGLSAAYRDFYHTVLVHSLALPGFSRRLLK